MLFAAGCQTTVDGTTINPADGADTVARVASPASDAAAATSDVTVTPEVSPEITVTPEVSPEVDEPDATATRGIVVITATPADDDEDSTASEPQAFAPVSADGAFALTVSHGNVYGGDSENPLPENFPPPPDGEKLIMVTASLFNNTAPEPVRVQQSDIALIDEAGNRYSVTDLSDQIQPVIYDLVLAEGESIYGFAVFALPADANVAALEWCPTGSCLQPLRADINVIQ